MLWSVNYNLVGVEGYISEESFQRWWDPNPAPVEITRTTENGLDFDRVGSDRDQEGAP